MIAKPCSNRTPGQKQHSPGLIQQDTSSTCTRIVWSEGFEPRPVGIQHGDAYLKSSVRLEGRPFGTLRTQGGYLVCQAPYKHLHPATSLSRLGLEGGNA